MDCVRPADARRVILECFCRGICRYLKGYSETYQEPPYRNTTGCRLVVRAAVQTDGQIL